jgi:hypothetical protein
MIEGLAKRKSVTVEFKHKPEIPRCFSTSGG